MANYRAVSSGVWSALARWEDDSTGSYVASTVLPGAADVVYANTFTITLDIDIVVAELRTNSATGVSNGGVFNYGDANSVTANAFAGQNVNCVVSSSGTKTFIGNTFGNSTVITALGNFGALVCTGGVLNHIGNSFGATAANNGPHVGVVVGTLLRGAGSATINQYGTATGGITPDSIRLRANGSANASTGTFNLFGLAIGSPTSTVNFSAGALNDSTGVMNIQTVQWGASIGASNSSTGQLNIQNVILNSNNAMPVSGAFRFTNNTTNSIIITKRDNSTKTLVEADTTDIPVATDVRNGVSYASGALTGTLAVPAPSNVRAGVPTDNTVGTADLTAQDFWNYLTASATTPGSLGKLIADYLDAAVSSRLATVGYTAPDNTSISDIKAKTDNLPVDPASQTDVQGVPPAVVSEIASSTDPVAERLRNVSTVSTTAATVASYNV